MKIGVPVSVRVRFWVFRELNFAAIYSEHQALKNKGEMSVTRQKQHGLIRFSFACKLFCNDLEVNRAPTSRAMSI